MHHFPFHIGDFATATARFDLVQTGLYLRLLMEYYGSEEALTDDLDLLAFKTGAKSRAEIASLKLILKLCFTYDAAQKVYIQARCEEEIAAYYKNVLQSRYANLCRHWGKVNPDTAKPDFGTFAKQPDSYFEEATGHVRKVAARNSFALQEASKDAPKLPRPESHPFTNHHSPITNHQDTPIVPSGDVRRGPSVESMAEAIYLIYPLKVGKKAAIKAIIKALKESKLTEMEMQAKVKAYRDATRQWPADERRFIPHPATWFNQGRYADDPESWQRDSVDSKPNGNREKKEGGAGAAAVKPPAAEPEWDWRGLAAELWGRRPDGGWFELPKSSRFELREAWAAKNKKNEGGAGA